MNLAVSDVARSNPEHAKVEAYPLFDWLRFVLASVVVLAHANFVPTIFSNLSVRIFFALSGWLIGSILLRTQKAELPRFFFNRATRIWIPYAVAIVILYSLAAARDGIDFFWIKYLLMDVTFTHQLFTFFPAATYEMPLGGSGNQFWSIAVEEQFYLLAPLLMLFVPRGKSILVWAAVALATAALSWNFASVSLGVCAAVLHRDHRIADLAWARLAALVGATVLGLIMIANVATYWIVSPFFSALLVVALAWPGRRSAVALVAGGLSYPLYLNHWIAAFIVNFLHKYVLAMHWIVHLALNYLTAVGIALCLYWVIDRNIQIHRNRWYTPPLGRTLGIIAYVLVTVGIVSGYVLWRYGPHGAAPAELAAPP